MARSGLMVFAGMVLACLLLCTTYAEGTMTCGQVVNAMSPCINYLRSGGALPPGCCTGVRNLNNAAQTTPDRQTACGCLKQASNSISGLNPALAQGLPGKCGVNIPYDISPSTDCSKVK